MEKVFKREGKPDIKLAVENDGDRIFITVGGLVVDVHASEDGVGVEIQLDGGNEVLDDCSADYVEGAE